MSQTGSRSSSRDKLKVFSTGHSNLALERFILLLQIHGIDVLVDVRSQPYSKWASQFNHDNLRQALKAKRISYIYLGKELGGRPDSDEFYDAEGHVLYDVLAKSALFQGGIQRLKRGVRNHRLAVMCSEEDPKGCHRTLLIGRVLEQQGVTMEHIRSDGRLQTEEQLNASESEEAGVQLFMLAPQEDVHWRSAKPIRSASPSDEQQISSGP